jgi:hypothetical protein
LCVNYRTSRDTFPTPYTVTALLPNRDGQFKYQIRRQGSASDLVVSDLRETRQR